MRPTTHTCLSPLGSDVSRSTGAQPPHPRACRRLDLRTYITEAGQCKWGDRTGELKWLVAGLHLLHGLVGARVLWIRHYFIRHGDLLVLLYVLLGIVELLSTEYTCVFIVDRLWSQVQIPGQYIYETISKNTGPITPQTREIIHVKKRGYQMYRTGTP